MRSKCPLRGCDQGDGSMVLGEGPAHIPHTNHQMPYTYSLCVHCVGHTSHRHASVHVVSRRPWVVRGVTIVRRSQRAHTARQLVVGAEEACTRLITRTKSVPATGRAPAAVGTCLPANQTASNVAPQSPEETATQAAEAEVQPRLLSPAGVLGLTCRVHWQQATEAGAATAEVEAMAAAEVAATAVARAATVMPRLSHRPLRWAASLHTDADTYAHFLPRRRWWRLWRWWLRQRQGRRIR